MALSVVYFKITHHWGRPHYVWDEYLYSVLQGVGVRVTMYSCLCSVIMLWSLRWWKEGRRWNPVPSHSLLFSKSTEGAARLNVPIRRTNRYQQYYMPSQHILRKGLYNLAIRKCTSPPLLAPRLKIFKWKFTSPLGIEPRTCWTRGRHATIWASATNYIHNHSTFFSQNMFN